MLFLWLFLLFVLLQYSLLQNLQVFIPMIIPLTYHSGRVVFLLKIISTENEKEHRIRLWIKRRDLATQLIAFTKYLCLILYIDNHIVPKILLYLVLFLNLSINLTCLMKFKKKLISIHLRKIYIMS